MTSKISHISLKARIYAHDRARTLQTSTETNTLDILDDSNTESRRLEQPVPEMRLGKHVQLGIFIRRRSHRSRWNAESGFTKLVLGDYVCNQNEQAVEVRKGCLAFVGDVGSAECRAWDVECGADDGWEGRDSVALDIYTL